MNKTKTDQIINQSLNENNHDNNDFIQKKNRNELFKKTLKNEIKKEKKRLFFISISAFIFFIISFILGSIAIAIDVGNLDENKLPDNAFFHWIPQIGLSLIFLWIFSTSIFSIYKIKQEEKFYYSDIFFETERIPNFIKNAFKRGIAVIIFVNWFSIVSYIVAGLFLCFLLIIRETETISISNIAKIKINLTDNQNNNLYENIVITSIYIASVFIFHLIIFLLISKRNSNLNIFFNLEKNIEKEEIRSFKKKVNIFCAIFFLFPLFFLFLFWWFKKKKKN